MSCASVTLCSCEMETTVVPKISFGGIPNSRNVDSFTNLSEACCEYKRWKHLSWVSVSYTAANPVNLTWLCTKASQTFSGTLSGTFSGTLLNLTSAPKPPDLLLRNSVEPDLALHQSLTDLLRNLPRNSVEPGLALHQSLFSGTFSACSI